MPRKVRVLLLLLFIICSNRLLADDISGSAIKGTITTSDGKPVADITVRIKENKRGTLTNEKGEYLLKNIKPGTYTLEISAVGIVPQEKNISIQENETAEEDFTINLTSQQLQDVIVNAGGNMHTQPSSTLRLNTSLIETPQNITVTGQRTMKDIGALDISDILRTSSGTYVGYGSGQDVYIVMRGMDVSNSHLRDGVGGGYTFYSSEDVGMIDRVEFIKGPASYMISNTYPAGLMNVVTKQPTDQKTANVNFGYGSYNMMRATADLGGKLTKDSSLTYRLNAGIQNQDQFFKFGYFKKYYVAGALKYRIDDNTEITAEYNRVFNHQQDDPMMLPTIDGKFFTLPQDFTMSDPNSPGLKTHDNFYRVNAVHRFNAQWSVNAQVAALSSDFAGYNITEDHTSPDYDTLYRDIIHNHTFGSQYSSQIFLNGTFYTGKNVKHKLLLGIDYGNTSWEWNGGIFNGSANSVALYLPDPAYYIPTDSIENFSKGGQSITKDKYTAFFAQDAVTFFDKIILSFGGRYTHNIEDLNFTPYEIKDDKFTPRLGLTYLFTPDISAYLMFDQSFVPQSGTDYSGKAFKPMYGSDHEFGFKGYFFNKALSINADAYEIVQNNNLTTDLAHPGFSVQTGQTKTKGIELDINGDITKQLRIMANYAYTKSKITKDNDASLIGMPNWGSSPNLGNIFLKYTFTNTVVKGLSFGVGAQYTDKTYWNADLVNYLPSYTLLQASLGYSIRNFYVNLNASNLTNKKYATYGYMTSDKDWSYQRGEPTNFRIDFGIHL